MKKGCAEKIVCFTNIALALVLLIMLLLFKFVFADSTDFSAGMIFLFATGLLAVLLPVFNAVFTVVGFVRGDMRMAIYCILFFILGLVPFVNLFAPKTGNIPMVFSVMPIAGYVIVLVLGLFYLLRD